MSTPARAEATLQDGVLEVALAGTWRITRERPHWREAVGQTAPGMIRPNTEAVEQWDSSLLLFLYEAREWAREARVSWSEERLPQKIRDLLAEFAPAPGRREHVMHGPMVITGIGLGTQELLRMGRDLTRFIGEAFIAAGRAARSPGRFRLRECLAEMQQAGAMALPIVGLISVLVGVTLAYTGAVVLRQYGGDIYVADLVGISMVREMGAVMTGIVIAGRTGAAFAATIANMKMNEEIDALETLGVSAIDFLVLPRLLAVGVMMPLLVLYANAFGIFGGMVIALGVLDIPPQAYWVEMLTIVDLSDTVVGLIKALTFGLLIGLSGCLCGIRADRSAEGVGRAATSAVVLSILLIIISDAVYAVVFNVLKW